MQNHAPPRARLARLCVLWLGAAALVGCQSSEGPVLVVPASLSFQLDAPLCGSRIPAQFLLDGRVIGVDTFRIHLPPDHIESVPFTVTLGAHVVGARVTLGATPLEWPDARDTVVTFGAGAAYTRVLPFYCS